MHAWAIKVLSYGKEQQPKSMESAGIKAGFEWRPGSQWGYYLLRGQVQIKQSCQLSRGLKVQLDCVIDQWDIPQISAMTKAYYRMMSPFM